MHLILLIVQQFSLLTALTLQLIDLVMAYMLFEAKQNIALVHLYAQEKNFTLKVDTYKSKVPLQKTKKRVRKRRTELWSPNMTNQTFPRFSRKEIFLSNLKAIYKNKK